MYLKQCKKSCRGRQLSFPGKKGSHVVWIISSVCNRSWNQEIIKSGNMKKKCRKTRVLLWLQASKTLCSYRTEFLINSTTTSVPAILLLPRRCCFKEIKEYDQEIVVPMITSELFLSLWTFICQMVLFVCVFVSTDNLELSQGERPFLSLATVFSVFIFNRPEIGESMF